MEKQLKIKYQHYIINNVAKDIYIKMIPIIFIMLFFVYNDIYIIDSVASFYTRLIVLIPSFILIFLRFFFSKRKKLIYVIYSILLSIAPIMMYIKIYLHQNSPLLLSSSLIGAILVIFIISLDLKVKLYQSILIYLVPFLIFFSSVIIYTNIEIHYISINIFPIIIIGFILNTIFNKQLYNTFKTSFMLEKERKLVTKQNEELKILNQTKNRFFSIISHDLKSPFNIILGFSEILDKDYDKYTEEKRKFYINKIQTSANTVFTLLENLLDWSSLQIKGRKIELENTNIYNFINEVTMPLRIVSSKKNIKLINLISNEINIDVDKYSNSVILGNLINNAIKFSFEDSKIEISASLNANKITYQIRDFGTGMTEDCVNNIFNLNKQNSKSGTKDEKGSGLGLIICKELVEINKGEIWVESEVDKGTTFYVSIPF